MPRQSRTDKLLADQELTLELEVRRAAAEAELLAGKLRLVRDLRKQLAAAPKRASRAKGRAATPAESKESTASLLAKARAEAAGNAQPAPTGYGQRNENEPSR